MLQLACSLQSRPADVVSIASADNSLYLLYNSLYFSYSVHVATIAAFRHLLLCLHGMLAFKPAAVHACICCLLAFMAAAVHACICCLLAFKPAAVHAGICCLLAFMAAAVHACICCLLLPEASHLWCFIVLFFVLTIIMLTCSSRFSWGQ